jgi:tRNA A-37 threonylcarbamoyl transferase component Bud32
MLSIAIAALLVGGLALFMDLPKDYIAKKWSGVLQYNGLTDFDALWQLELTLVGNTNHKIQPLAGYSNVSRGKLRSGDGKEFSIFVKRQKNYRIKDIWHPIRGAMTLSRELTNLHRYRRLGILCPTPLYFVQRSKIVGSSRAILIVEELNGFQDLRQFLFFKYPQLSTIERKTLIYSVARAVRKLHNNHLQHSSLYPRHIFIHPDNSGTVWQIAFIDLERTRLRLFSTQCTARDLDTFNRTAKISRTDKLRFLLAYQGQTKVNKETKKLWREIAELSRKKIAKQQA